MKFLIGCCLALGLVAGCGGGTAVVSPEYDLTALGTNYTPTVGTPRADVEAVYGKPTWTGYTKDKQDYAMYQIEGAPEGIIKSVIYDAEGNVALAYR